MKGAPKVIEELNEALREELTAIKKIFLHAEMCENWSYEKLSDFIKKQSIGERQHGEALMERILFLDGSRTMEAIRVDSRERRERDARKRLGARTRRSEGLQRGDTGCGGRKR
jgi:bacterioferritin